MARWLLLFFLVMPWPARPLAASDTAAPGVQADLQFSANAQGPLWVGEKRELYLDLWTNGMMFSKQRYVLPEVPGGFLMQVDTGTVKLSERRGGETWQGLRYTFQFYAQRPGALSIPAFDVRFEAREAFNAPAQAFAFTTQPLTIEAIFPPGAETNGLLVSTTAFVLDSDWTPAPDSEGVLELKRGDALTLNVSREAADVPGMVFAPLAEPQIEGLGVYTARPVVNDRTDRGVLTGVRTDKLTFICEQAGQYRIPEMVFQWWNPEQETLSSQTLPALQLNVSDNPAWGAAGGQQGADSMPFRVGILYGLVPVLLLLLSIQWWSPYLVRWFRAAVEWRRGRDSHELVALNPRSFK
jgi:hypothetical protein